MRSSASPIPVYVITGFLGAGKTTLLRQLLLNSNQQRLAVLRNEFTDTQDLEFEVPLLVHEDDSDAFASFWELPNSCVCCTAKSQFLQALTRLVDKSIEEERPFQAVLVEVSGLADPIAVYNNLTEGRGGEEEQNFVVAGVITVVDASRGVCHDVLLGSERTATVGGEESSLTDGESTKSLFELAVTQLTTGDVILMNKEDQLSASPSTTRTQLETAVAALNPTAKVIWTSYCQVTLEELQTIFSATALTMAAAPPQPHSHLGIESVTVILPEETLIDPVVLEERLGRWLWDEPSPILYRAKGLFRRSVQANDWYSLQIVGDIIEVSAVPYGCNNGAPRFLFVGKELSESFLRGLIAEAACGCGC